MPPKAQIVWPPLTRGLKILLIAYAAVFVFTLFEGSLGIRDFIKSTFYLSFAGMFERFYLWQPLTYQFLHADFFHILFNSIVLYSFGGEVEKRWNTKAFIGFVLLCGLGSAAVVLLWDVVQIAIWGSPGAAVVGASGGIYGVIVAFALYNWNRPMSLMFIPGRFAAKWLLVAFPAIDILFILLGANTSFAGHMGGFATGALIVTGYYKPNRLIDRIKLWRVRRKLRLMRGGHPLEHDPDKPGKYLN